jgi:methionyl aminopeptidase
VISIKSQENIAMMKRSGAILASIINELKAIVRPGIITKELDDLAAQLILQNKVQPAFLGYGGFPANVCVSINEEIVHGIPSQRELKEGDLLSIDMGVIYEGWYSDSAITMIVDKNDDQEIKKLINVTKEALAIGIKQAQVGNHIGAISHAIQSFVELHGYGIVRELVGHGIGRELHEDPHVPNFGSGGEGPQLKEGMVIAIEPMITMGDPKIELAPDGFTYKTKDNSLSAHFEHTIAITKNGPEILTH